MSFTFDQVDFVRFAPVALRLAIKKGFLNEHKKGNETSKSFYALVGNLMFIYEAEGDPSSLSGLLFLESSTVRLSNSMGFMALSISTVGGKTFSLSATTNGELQEWMDAIESNKFLSMTRKLEDNEANSVQLVHRVEQQELVQQDYEKSFVELKEQLKASEEKSQNLLAQLTALQAEQADLKKQLKSSENERLLLLKSRGITPKSVPLWALSENPREGVKEIVDKIKIWTGTWNLGSAEPFAGMDKTRAQRLLQPFIPPGYDVYVLGVQECVSDSIFECFDGLLVAEGCRKLRLDSTNIASSLAAAANGGATAATDMSKLLGRGDGSLLSLKFTGMAIYVRLNLLGDARVLAVTNFPFTSVQSRGAVAAAISVFGRNMLFINSHLEAKNNDIRREQYTKLVIALGSQLAETGFHLTEQFHHVIWFGDLNYRLVDTSGNRMPVDTAMKLMEDGRLFRTLFETHDQLNQDKRSQLVFFGFREPTPFPNFYPTYKKLENRPPVDYTNPNWVKNTYRLFQKDPFFKGGKNQEKTPGFCDRILYHSMADLVEDLLPESVAVDMNVYVKSKDDDVQHSGESASNIPKSMNVSIDNYRSVNDGEGLVSSDHSPVFGTFVLKLRHDYEKLLRESRNKKSVGNIHTVFTALSSSEQRAEALQSAGMYTTPTASPQKSRPGSSIYNRDNLSGVASALTSQLAAESDGTINDDEGEDVVINKVYKYSLLPHGVYRIRISDIKLVWGLNEDIPTAMAVLFPAPFEAEAGERFVGFHSETPSEGINASGTSMSYSLPGLPYGDGLSSSPIKGGTLSRQMSPAGKPTAKMNKINTDFDASIAARSTNIAALVEEGLQWKKVGPSKTGTCLGLEVSQHTRGGSGAGGSSNIPPLQLVWRGDEPLDKLHVVMKATVCASGISSTTVKKSSNRKSMSGAEAASLNAGGPPDTFAEDEDSIVGHCAVGLEQLCKVAMVSSGGASGCISVSRLLVSKGKPMFNIDPKTMQREMVTLTCQLELMPNI